MVANFNHINHIGRVSDSSQRTPATKRQVNGGSNFDSILKEKLKGSNDIKFSRHAEMRMQMRNIQLTELQVDKISKAIDKAEDKGVRDSLVLMDNLAFVVNVKNRTVITAVNSSELKENVFTNIDGAVFA